MLAPAGQATARAGQLCWLAALVARRQAPRTPAAINFLSPCRGRACPARSLSPNPFHGQSVGEGFIPPGHFPAGASGHGGQRAGRPTTPLKNPCVVRGALTPPEPAAISLLRSIRRGGIHPSRALPAAANGHGGQRAGRPTHDPGRTADPRGAGDAAPYSSCHICTGV